MLLISCRSLSGAVAVVACTLAGAISPVLAVDYTWTDGWYFNSTVSPGLPAVIGSDDLLIIAAKTNQDYSGSPETGLKFFGNAATPGQRWTIDNLGHIVISNLSQPLYTTAANVLNNQGLIEVNTTGTFWQYGGGWGDNLLLNSSTGVIRMQADGELLLPFAGSYWDETIFNNEGQLDAVNPLSTIVYSTPAMTFVDGSRFSGQGTHRFTTWGYAMTPIDGQPYTVFAGSITVDPQTTVIFGGTPNQQQAPIYAGTQASLHGKVNLEGGIMAGGWEVAADGEIVVKSSAGGFQGTGLLSNLGTITLQANTPFHTMTLQNAGLLDIQGDYGIGRNGAGNIPSLVNQGVIRKSDGSGTSILGSYTNTPQPDMYFANESSGVVEVQVGTLYITSESFQTNHGTLDVSQDAVLKVQLYHNTLTNDGTISGKGTLELIGGQAKLVNLGQVDPGNSPGYLTILGNYEQADPGELNIEVAGTGAGQFDVLTVTGFAAIGGDLNLILLPQYVPSVGDTFAFLTACSISGEFSNINVIGRSGIEFGEVDVSNGVARIAVTAVPEPASFMLLGASAALLTLRSQRTL